MKTKKPKTVTRTMSIPVPLETVVDRRVEALDTDFSKYLRSLIRKDLKEAGIEVAAA